MKFNPAFLISMVVANSIASFSALSADEAIRVAMRSTHVSVSRPDVSVGDVCRVQGGSAKLRDEIAALDLDTVVPGKVSVISSKQVAVRVALSGVLAKSILPTGPKATEVSLVRDEDLQQRLEGKISAELSRQFGISVQDIRVRLLEAATLDRIRQAIDTTRFEVMAFFPSQVPLGDTYVQVDLTDASGARLSQRLQFHIVVLRNVFVTSSVVPRGTVITRDHVTSIRRPLAARTAEPAGIECLGCTASRDIPAHEVLTTRHLGRRPKITPDGVKRNDLVDIVVTKGVLTVRIKNAKVMSNGAKGQTVRVLNTNSNKEVSAVVVDRSTVMVRN